MKKEKMLSEGVAKGSKDPRLEQFEGFTIAHPSLVKGYTELLKVIRRASPATLIFLYGPSGVGKTTLLQKVRKELTEEILSELDKDRGRIPLVEIELVAPDSGNFNWKELYRRMLVSMDEPLIDRKINYERESSVSGDKIYFRAGPRAVTADLRFSVEQTLKQRRPVAVIIDEGQHLAKMASGRKLQDQLDCLKSLSNQTGILFVIIGTYELLVLRNLSAQLSRRSIHVHFKRYSAITKEDVHAFKSVLLTFQKRLPLKVECDLVARWDYFYERSIGCVGVLKEWLVRALGEALDEGSDCLTDEHLEKYALSVAQCQTMLSDALKGEEKLSETKTGQRLLRTALGLDGENGSNGSGNVRAGVVKQGTKKRSGNRPRVGRRIAKRDLVGEQTLA